MLKPLIWAFLSYLSSAHFIAMSEDNISMYFNQYVHWLSHDQMQYVHLNIIHKTDNISIQNHGQFLCCQYSVFQFILMVLRSEICAELLKPFLCELGPQVFPKGGSKRLSKITLLWQWDILVYQICLCINNNIVKICPIQFSQCEALLL